MSNTSTFTIQSVGAALIEVDGDGPIKDTPNGIAVPDGVATTTPVDLLNRSIRRWRVNSPPTTQAVVTVSDSPYGAFVGLRRCVPLPVRWWHFLAVERWPRIARAVTKAAPSIGALWYLLTDHAGMSCRWRDVGTDITTEVTAQGGDLVVVTFVSP